MATINIIGTGLTGTTGSGSNVGATSPTLVTPVLGAASATSLSFSSTSGIIGTTTNDSAAAGSVGEEITSAVLYASRQSATSGAGQDITSITLTAGDWDVQGSVSYDGAVSTVVAYTLTYFTTVSQTPPDRSYVIGAKYPAGYTPFDTYSVATSLPFRTFHVANGATLIVYLDGIINFSVSTANMCGTITARRVR